MSQITPFLALTALILTMVGWLVTYNMSVRAQRRHFINTVRDAARRELVIALRREQRWAGKVELALMQVQFAVAREELGTKIGWNEEREKLSSAVYDNRESLLMVFEEYEHLFPETTMCRGELTKIGFEILKAAQAIADGVRTSDTRGAALEQIDAARALCTELSLLIEDVRVYVQNRVFAEITGQTIEARLGPNKQRPRILPDPNGKLRIVR